jgi:DNA-nicking Smr family endonuclease
MKRPLTPDEEKMWERVTQADKPLRKKTVAKVEKQENTGKKKIHVKQKAHIPLPSHSHTLTHGSYDNIDRNTSERFRKGDYPIDGTIDLHGMTHDKAEAALSRFIASHYGRGNRCLLVITGKGVVLREALPRWLAESDLRSVILAFDTAKQKDGGSGAYYILLKRKRGKE